ncbi:hypothetical protein ADUPG1_010799, partial [Aduncisulcus paluster]
VESALESVPKPSEQDSFDKFHEVMGSFHKQAVLSVSSVKEDLDTIEEDHRKTSEAFGEIPSKFPLDEMILMMIGFVNEIKSNIQQIAADKEKEKKIAKKKEEKKEEAEKALSTSLEEEKSQQPKQPESPTSVAPVSLAAFSHKKKKGKEGVLDEFMKGKVGKGGVKIVAQTIQLRRKRK